MNRRDLINSAAGIAAFVWMALMSRRLRELEQRPARERIEKRLAAVVAREVR